jgi:murein L,D-transpeptidase YafK
MGAVTVTGNPGLASCARYGRAALASVALAAAIAVGGCDTDSTDFSARALKPLSPAMLAELERKNMPKESPILIRLFKEEAELEVWKQDSSGQFALLRTYPICRWSGELGPKVKEGDRQAPEGFYAITPAQMNPNSHYYLAFNIGYPNSFDRAWGHTGSDLMVHGDCSSRGCYAMTDDQIGEIYALARESFFGGQHSFQVQAYPFHMTALNMARHHNNPNLPFWTMLKDGSDHFEVTHLEPKVDVCEKRYVFDAQPIATPVPAAAGTQTAQPAAGALHFNPTGRCPAYQMAPDVAAAIEAKRHRDAVETAELVSRGTPTVPVRTGMDGGTNAAFLSSYQPEQFHDAQGQVHTVVTRRAPGVIPANSNPPRDTDAVIAANATGSVVPASVTAPSNTQASGGKFGLASSESKPGAQTTSSGGNLFTRLFRLGGDDKKPDPAAQKAPAVATPAPTVHNRPAPHPAPATVVAAKPAAKPKTEPLAPSPREAQNPPSSPAPRETQNPPAAPPKVAASTPNGLLTGAQPVVPVGTFDSRWSAIQ